MLKLINRYRREEHGVAMVEYGILIGLIALACFAAIQASGIQINAVFTFLTAALAAVV